MSLDKLLPKLLKAQSEFPAIPKNGYNPHFKSKFILLDDVLRLCLPVLRNNDLVLAQTIYSVDGNNKLVTTLYHISGQYIMSDMALINKAGTDQGLGSSISYAKRYSLIAMLGLSDDDDDAEATKIFVPKGSDIKDPLKHIPESAKPVEKKTLTTTQVSKTSQPVVKLTDIAINTSIHDPPKIATYKVKFGKKYRGKTFDQIGPKELKNYRDYIQKNINPDSAQEEVMEFLSLSKEYLDGCK